MNSTHWGSCSSDFCLPTRTWEGSASVNVPTQSSVDRCACVTLGMTRFSTSPASCVAPRLHHASCPSLAFISGLQEFPGRPWKPVRVSGPHPSTHPHWPQHHLPNSQPSLLFLFPDCNASVHKGCRDSLPACAKVKMKVSSVTPAPCRLVGLFLCSRYWFIFSFLLCFSV